MLVHKETVWGVLCCAVQAGFKYWLVLCIVLEVTLGLLYSLPVLRPLNPGFGIVAAALTMSQKVEATVSKVRCTILGA
jgi:hypothetical protein